MSLLRIIHARGAIPNEMGGAMSHTIRRLVKRGDRKRE